MNNNQRTIPFLQFDFQLEAGAKQAPLLFSNPSKVITTNDISAVSACLNQINDCLEQGFYVAGYFSYESTYAFSTDISSTDIHNRMPLLWFGVFEQPNETQFASLNQGEFHIDDWQMKKSKQQYEKDFQKVMDAIQANKTNQINYTVPFEAHFSGNPFLYYEQLKQAQSSNFCAYIQLEQFSILSASPELFFQVKDDNIMVRPMKGTAKRGRTYQEDIKQKYDLQQSEKNKLENKLITELMKEELENVAEKDSIQIIDPFRVEQYPTVYQMTTGIKGKIHGGLSIMEIIQILFPCGSISGVPKSTSLQLIADIEQAPREVYCGAIGYITPNKEAVFNVPIRTVWIDKQYEKAYYGAGGAITKNSIMQEEYEEVLSKTNVLTRKQPDFKLLETMLIEDGNVFLLEKHIQRLAQSAAYFNIPIDIKKVQKEMLLSAATYPEGKHRIRLTVSKVGHIDITVTPYSPSGVRKVAMAKAPINKEDVFLYHKTTFRDCYTKHKTQNTSIFDILLWNDRDEITEFTIGNIVVELDNKLYTPPVSSGLLSGTFRQKLLDEGKIKEKVIIKKDLLQCTNIWLINSVRKWVRVEL